MTDPRPYVAGAALLVIAAVMAWPLVRYGYRQFRRMGLAFALVSAAFLWSMATKPSYPSVTFDDYLADDGTAYVTNGMAKVGVSFAWRKTNPALPDTQPLYVSKRQNPSDDWTLAATTTVGASPFTLTLASPDSYQYYVWHEWIPPTPVHTNGVWLGNVVEPAVGVTNSAAKMVIIHGQLINNGKVIAP